MTLWTIPAVNGKRRALDSNGYFPRFSPDGRSLLFWNLEALWISGIDGHDPKRIKETVPAPLPGAWLKGAPRTYLDSDVNGGRKIWPEFDVLPDGRVLAAPIEIRDTALWSVDLTYVE
jgi:hypothetical protein